MKKTPFRILAVSVLVLMLVVPCLAAEMETTVIGQVTDDYQIVTEQGDVYEVADTEMGNDLLNHVGKKVEATGTVFAQEGVTIIKVTSYAVLEEKKEE